MIRLVLRFFAYLLLAATFAIAVIDATRWIESETLVLTPFTQAPALLLSTKPGAFETAVKDHIAGFLWDPAFLVLLHLPASLVLTAIAVILFRLARQRRQKIGFQTY